MTRRFRADGLHGVDIERTLGQSLALPHHVEQGWKEQHHLMPRSLNDFHVGEPVAAGTTVVRAGPWSTG